jgi:uncharacterized membrane protein
LQIAAPQARNPQAFAAAVMIFGTLGLFLFQTWINIGQILVLLDIARGREASFGDVFTGGRYLLRAILAMILFGLVMIGTVVLGMVPGVLVWAAVGRDAPAGPIALVLGCVIAAIVAVILSLRLSQFLYVIIDRDEGALDALRISAQITRGHLGTIFVLYLLMFAINFGGVLACFIGLIFTAPFTVLMLAVTYLALTGQPTADPYAKGEPLADLEPL